MGIMVLVVFIIIASFVGVIFLYLSSAKKRKEETNKALNEAATIDYFTTTKSIGNYIYVDEKRRKWAVPTKLPYGIDKFAITKQTPIYNFSDILNYELYINDSKSKIGKTGNHLTAQTICTSMYIKISVKNISNPAVYIKLLYTQTPMNSMLYNLSMQGAQNVLSLLDNISQKGSDDIIEIKKPEFSKAVSIPDEIKKYKELLDIGAITQEEFNKKKKELLNQ